MVIDSISNCNSSISISGTVETAGADTTFLEWNKAWFNPFAEWVKKIRNVMKDGIVLAELVAQIDLIEFIMCMFIKCWREI